ncbi:preprotein translocase subunit SecE [candidate division KSB1 bacterium]
MITRIKAYLLDVRNEMSKVSWPTFQELLGSTYIVIISSALLAVFIFGVDRFLNTVMNIVLQ